MIKVLKDMQRAVAVQVFLVFVFSAMASASVSPSEVRLAEDGEALFPVVISADASELVESRADELAEYLGRITGAEFEVERGDGMSGIAVGVFTDFPALETGVSFDGDDPFRREEYLLRTHENGVLIIGTDARGMTHAVWGFLHDIGYRLFFLTDTWEIVPDIPDLSVSMDKFETTDFVTRQAPRGAPWSDGALWTRWRDRNRMTPAFRLSTGHVYGRIESRNREEFEANPEYYALVDGERRVSGGNRKFCISNPGLRQLVVDDKVRRVEANPEIDSVSIDPSDGGNWCECDECAELGSISDQAIVLANDVAEAINDLGHGEKYVGIYAYNQHSPPPNIRVHPNVVVSIATSFIRGGYTLQELIEGWSEKTDIIGIRDYHDVFPWSHDMPRRARGGNISYLEERIPYFYEHGARFMNSEAGDSWGANGLGFWLSPILLWDVSAAERVEDYVEDFLEKAFGPAKEPMHDFYEVVNMDRSLRTAEDVTGRMYIALEEARELTDDPDINARLDDLVLFTRYTELYNLYRGKSGDERQKAFEQVWRHAYRIRDRMLLSTVALCHRDRFRDRAVSLPEGAEWGTPEDEHPWKDSTPFSEEELGEIVSAGIEANPIQVLDFEPVAYSEELVPAAEKLDLPEVTPGNFRLRGRGTRRFHTWLDEPGEITLKVTGGLIAHYRDRGNVQLRLYSSKEATLEPVDTDDSVPPDGNEYEVTLRSPYSGYHILEVSDGSDMTNLVMPDDLPLNVLSSMENPPGRTLGGRWSLYFYVPKGTDMVGGFTRDLRGRMIDTSGNEVLSFAELESEGYFSVPVPDGEDGGLWKIENSGGHKLLMTVPPYLARSEKELLLPAEVVEADGN